MCGIAGIWGPVEPGQLERMLDAQSHRGPDGNGAYRSNATGALGHVRLAIMDPDHGAQPFENEDGSTVLVANGEIYNHAAVRAELGAEHRYRSTSDSETILHAFEEYGEDVTRRIDGPFAFAVARGERVFLARDPIGIKPLYYGFRGAPDEQRLCFASEVKSLATVVDEVKEFAPGTSLDSERGVRRFYEVPDVDPQDVPVEQQRAVLRATLDSAVTKRLMADVPVGAFLSGGLDSSAIAALARRHVRELHTFCVGIEGSRDLEAGRYVAAHIDSIHHEYAYTLEEVLEKLPEIVFYLESFDRDLVRSAIPTYFCARLAADHVKVILTGEGADELFAGYTYHKEYDDPVALGHELRRSITSLHNLNLQRVDRLTMRHSVEGRVPFLDTEMIRLAQTIPVERKLLREPGKPPVEKWILRRAVEDLLPHDIVWRDKEQFDEGSGTVDLIPRLVEEAAAGFDWAAHAARYEAHQLRSSEEALYHHLLAGAFERPEAALNTVGRWRM